MTPQPLPEVREAEASTEIRAIYDDIKTATGIPQVNLIFRHLALEPAVLEWAWSTIGPLYRSGAIAEGAVQLERRLGARPLPPVWQGMAESEARKVRAVLAFYNRGNPANLIGLTTLVSVARSPTTDDAPSSAGDRLSSQSASSPLEDEAEPVPPFPRREDLPPEAARLARELAARQSGAEMGVTPSLYLHIALWPDVMRNAYDRVLPMVTAAGWPHEVKWVIGIARELADGLAGQLIVPAQKPPEDVLQPYIRTIQGFVTGPIPEMVLIGRALAGRGAESAA
jgi:hypothetical protein